MFRKNVCYGEHQIFFEMKEGYKASCVKILSFGILLGGWYLFEMYHSSLIHCEN